MRRFTALEWLEPVHLVVTGGPAAIARLNIGRLQVITAAGGLSNEVLRTLESQLG